MREKENTSLNLFIFCTVNIYKSCLNEIKDRTFLEVLGNVQRPEVNSENLFHDYLYVITYIYISLGQNLDKRAQ